MVMECEEREKGHPKKINQRRSWNKKAMQGEYPRGRDQKEIDEPKRAGRQTDGEGEQEVIDNRQAQHASLTYSPY